MLSRPGGSGKLARKLVINYLAEEKSLQVNFTRVGILKK
jgi:hypothetical protein